MASESAILSWMLLVPAVGGGLVFALPQAYAKKARPIALAFLGATFVISCIAAGWFDWGADGNRIAGGESGDIQLASRLLWPQLLGASFHLGVDGLSMLLVLLASGMGVVACWASYGINRSPRGYFAMLLWLVTAMLGVFTARDLMLLVVFIELAVPPIYFLIGIWGGGRKDYAASKFLLFAMISSVGLLVVVTEVYRATQGPSGSGGIFDLLELANNAVIKARLASGFGTVSFWVLLTAFILWIGVVPLHTWLNDAIVEAPTPVAMLLLGVVTKIGIYGIIRVAYPLFAAEATRRWECLAALGIISMLYGVLAALVQKDLRRMLVFASIAQMGYVLLGIAVLTPVAMAGVTYQLIAHGVAMGMLVFITGMIADRTGHCDMRKLGGLAGHMPAFAGWSAVAFLSAMGLPGLCGFMGEFLILLGTFMAADPQSLLMRAESAGSESWMLWLGVTGAAAMILTGACFIWTYQRIFLGAPRPEHSNVARLSSSEKWILATFGAASLAAGVMPGLLTEPMRGWVEDWIRMISRI